MDGQTHATPTPTRDQRPRRGLRVLGGGAATICLALAGLVTTTTPVTAAQAERIGGTDRIDTAIKVFEQNREVFTSDTAVLTRSDNFADPLTATPLAAALKAPVLTTAPTDLDDRVLASLKKQRVKRIIAIGGESALTPAVLAELTAAGMTPERISGPDRYATAHRIADLVMKTRGQKETAAFVATGNNFPDALAAGTAAAATGAVVMLSQGNHLDDATRDFLTSPKVTKVTAVGGPAAAAMKATGRATAEAVGTTRYETAVLLAKLAFTKPGVTVIASGETYADSLAGGALAALLGGPLLLTPAGELSPATKSYLGEVKPNPVVLGGPSAVSPGAVEAVQTSVGAGPNPNPTQSPTPTPTKTTPTPTSTRTPGNSGGGGGGNATADFRITSDLPAEVKYSLGWPFGDHVTVGFDSTEGVTFDVWTRPAGGRWAKSDSHVHVTETTAFFAVGEKGMTAGSWDGAEVQLVATKNGATVRSAVAVARGVKTSENPTVAKEPAVNRVVSSALTTKVPVKFMIDGADPANLSSADTYVTELPHSWLGDLSGPEGTSPSVYTGFVMVEHPGSYSMSTAFFPRDHFKTAYVRHADEGGVVVTEDPTSPLHNYRVTVKTEPDRYGYNLLSAQVQDAAGRPVRTGGVVFRSQGGRVAVDTDGSNGWTGYALGGNEPVRAAYVSNNNPDDWATYLNPMIPIGGQAFDEQPAKYSQPVPLMPSGDRVQLAELSSSTFDAISSQAVKVPLTTNGSPVTLRSLLPNSQVVPKVAPSDFWAWRGEVGKTGSLPTFNYDPEKKAIIVTGQDAPPGKYTGYYDFHVADELGQRQVMVPITFTIK